MVKSLPVWEEWIEIMALGIAPCHDMSLPVWEEWIEIIHQGLSRLERKSLPVWEEWIEIFLSIDSSGFRRVSSRMGRVD